MKPSLLPLGLLLCAPLAAQSSPLSPASSRSAQALGFVTVFTGAPNGFGDVVVHEDALGTSVGAPPELVNLRLLPIDFVGRTELDEFLPTRPRLRTDVPGSATRLELPGGSGSLYRYERIVATGSRRFGHLWIARDGRPHPVAEVAGHGPGGDLDPFEPRVAVAPDGLSMLVATVVGAGGDLFDVDLESGDVTERTPHVGPISFGASGLWLGATWGGAATPSGVYRFARGRRGVDEVAELLALVGGPVWFAGEVVLSRNHEWAAIAAGNGPSAQYVYVVGPTGEAVRVSEQPMQLSGAGALPESPFGPYLAVSDDGEMCAWRSAAPDHHAFMSWVGGPSPDVQITSSTYFVNWEGQVEELAFLEEQKLTFSIGEADFGDDEGTEELDLFEASLDSSSVPTISNRTLSSGQPSPPFTAESHIKRLRTHVIPATGALLIHDKEEDELLGVLAGNAGVQVVLTDVDEVLFVEPTGGHLLLCVEREIGGEPHQLFRVAADLASPATLVDPGSEDVEFLHPVDRGDGWVGYLRRLQGTPDLVSRVDVATGTIEVFPPTAQKSSAPIGFTSTGAQVFAHGPAAGPNLKIVWPIGQSPFALQAPALAGFVLP